MARYFLLLRNNQQTGPFSFEEMLQKDLKPADLIWEEGRSAGWSHPSEINGLQFNSGEPDQIHKNTSGINAAHEAYLPPSSGFAAKNVTTSNRVFVSLPNGARPVEQVGEAKKNMEPPPVPRFQPAEEKQITQNPVPYQAETRKIKEPAFSEIPENEYSNWFYRQNIKKKKARRRQQWAGAFVVLLAAGYGIAQLLPSSQEGERTSVKPTVQKIIAYDHPAEQAPESSVAAPVISEPIVNNGSVTREEPGLPRKNKPLLQAPSTTREPEVSIASEKIAEETPEVSEVDVVETNSPTEATTAPAKKKKKLGEAISGVFGKLKTKKEEAPEAEPTRQPSRQTNGERVASRRNDNQQTAEGPSLLSKIDLKPSERPNNWMMGVVGMKLTLYNNSSETIKSATIEVSYYNEQNDLLQKKLMYFNNVGPKRTLTMAIPDHRMADHADYKVVTAIGKEDGYVKE
jgi:hypothetical protein